MQLFLILICICIGALADSETLTTPMDAPARVSEDSVSVSEIKKRLQNLRDKRISAAKKTKQMQSAFKGLSYNHGAANFGFRGITECDENGMCGMTGSPKNQRIEDLCAGSSRQKPPEAICNALADFKKANERDRQTQQREETRRREAEAKAEAQKNQNKNAAKSDGEKGEKKNEQQQNNPLTNAAAMGINAAAASRETPKNACDYESATRVRRDFEKVQNECHRNSRTAQKLCDANNNRGIAKALQEAKGAANEVAKSSGKSIILACDRYSKAAKKLKEALASYRESCMPAKASCENRCMALAESGSNVSDVISRDTDCYKQSNSIFNDIEQKAKQGGQSLLTCKAFDKPLNQAKNDANSLFQSMARAGVCEKQAAENCTGDSETGDCLNARNGHVGQMNRANIDPLDTNYGADSSSAEEGSIETVENDDNHDSHDSLSLSSGGSSANSVYGVSGNNKNGYNGERVDGPKGVKGTNSKATRKKKWSRKSGSASYSRSNRKRKYKFDFNVGKNADKGKRRLAAKSGSNSLLRKYLPGGQLDPSRDFGTDGITSATGPSLFEKVTNRYKVHEERMFQE